MLVHITSKTCGNWLPYISQVSCTQNSKLLKQRQTNFWHNTEICICSIKQCYSSHAFKSTTRILQFCTYSNYIQQSMPLFEHFYLFSQWWNTELDNTVNTVNKFSRFFIYTHTHTGAGHIIRISSKCWFISLIPFKKWNLYNVYIHFTQTDIFQVFILILMIIIDN